MIFPRPSAAPGWNKSLREIVSQITDGKIADYYRRDFEQKVFDSFKARKPREPGRASPRPWPFPERPIARPMPPPVSPRP